MDRMQQMLGQEYEAFLKTFDQEKYQALRLNALKAGMSGGSAAEILGEKGDCPGRGFARLTKVPWAENGYYYRSEDQPGKHPYHDGGLYYIQEPSAMVPGELLDARPGERILDLCAAPGGKSTQIAGKLQGRGLLISNEINSARAKILSENIERMGICNACVTNETPERLAGFFPAYFDRILVDAPCSGEGMFRKNEAACGEWSPENVALCARRQDGILDCAAEMLRPGGRLVYSTCTFAPEENEGSVERFLQRHKDFSPAPVEKRWFDEKANRTLSREGMLRLWPHRIKGEGHFAAVLEKAGPWPEGYGATGADGRTAGLREKELSELEGLTEFFRESLCFSAVSGRDEEERRGRRAAAASAEPSEGVRTGKSRKTASETTAGELPRALGSALGMGEDARFIRFGENLYLVPGEMPSLKGLKVLRPGLHIGEIKKNRFEPAHALALALPPGKAVHTWQLSSEDKLIYDYLKGGTFPAEGEKGWYLICLDGFGMGWGKLAGGIMKNHYPKGLRRN